MYQRIMAMRAHQALDPTPAFSDPSTCPSYPGPAITMLMPAHAVTAAVVETTPRWMDLSQVSVPRNAWVASSPLRVHAGRGPPETYPS
jgi:hypothetical protein